MDQKVKETLAKVSQELAEVIELEKRSKTWVTTGIVKINSDKSSNLKVENKDNLIMFMAHLLEKECFYRSAYKELGLGEAPDYKHDGYLIDEWKQDIKQRIELIDLRAKKDRLVEAEKKLKGILSEEQKRESTLNDVLDLIV